MYGSIPEYHEAAVAHVTTHGHQQGRTSPVPVGALGTVEHNSQPLAHPLSVRHTRAVVLTVAAAAVDHQAVRSVPTGGANGVRVGAGVIGGAVVAVPNRVLSAPIKHVQARTYIAVKR